MYNNSICEELGLEIDDKLDGGLSSADRISAHHCFTDGSFLRGYAAGWAFSVFGRGDAKGEGKPFLSAAGPIVTLRKSNFFVGAERLTSGVAEINAVIESLLWWASVGKQRRQTFLVAGTRWWSVSLPRQTTNNTNILSKLGKLLFLPWTPSTWLNFSRANAGLLKTNCWWTLWCISGNLLVRFFLSESAGAQATTILQRILFSSQALMLWTN